jgi:hypothetical protein
VFPCSSNLALPIQLPVGNSISCANCAFSSHKGTNPCNGTHIGEIAFSPGHRRDRNPFGVFRSYGVYYNTKACENFDGKDFPTGLDFAIIKLTQAPELNSWMGMIAFDEATMNNKDFYQAGYGVALGDGKNAFSQGPFKIEDVSRTWGRAQGITLGKFCQIPIFLSRSRANFFRASHIPH